jgi:tetratricopeptide (TPR) repeat protein
MAMHGGCNAAIKGRVGVARRWLVIAGVAMLAATLQVACTFAPRRGAPGPVPAERGSAPGAATSVDARSIEDRAAAIKAAAQRSDHESDSNLRANLATEASSNADACLALDPGAAACQYGKAVATGLEARVHPARAVGLLGSMLQNLGNAEAADPNYDKAGPARVRALVLIRAPGWPVGPGDTDAGLAAARRAVALQPDYPPNVLALAEALSKTGDENGARENYAHARDLAQSLPSGPERDDWLHDAAEGLAHR